MTLEIAKLNLPIDSKHFLLNHQIKENEFECLNIEFYTYSNGFFLDVVEWTKQNDFSLSILDKEFTERVERYFVNSSIEKMYCCFNYFKKCWIQLLEQEHYISHDLMNTFYELKNKLVEFDTNILINDDDYNRQFWNCLYHGNLNFLFKKVKQNIDYF
ncbi:hypothetical protein [Bacillus toyonensis]|uniref:hypothetical protein n=1 Tax=Bacillus toyonensis TaxID=155322 RepID=UPI0021CED362|nr:hypothetical protein [Bacillus toyonensis]MCU5181173.1 hypothetical protein [Bacillus toyonensis]